MSFALQQFTGKERDSETGLDFFGARYFSGAQGRFTSPDSDLGLKRILLNPQRWNRYAYVHNNPLAFVDPDGLTDIAVFLTYSPGDRGGRPPADWSRIQANAKQHGNTVNIYSDQSGNTPTAANFKAALSEGQVTVKIGHDDLAKLNAGDSPRAVATRFADASVGNPNLVRDDGNPTTAPPAVPGGIVAIFGCDSANLAGQYPGAGTFVGVDSGLGAGDMGITGLETSIPGLLYAGAAFVDTLASNGSIVDAVSNANKSIHQQPEDTGDKVVEKKNQ